MKLKVDPIIAVRNVKESSKWYQSIFDCNSIHGGDTFDVLVSDKNDVLLCIHKWNAHDHPTMQKPSGNFAQGLILYFRVENIVHIRARLKQLNYDVEAEIQMSPNSHQLEFSVRDLDGYYITVSEYHQYEG